MPDKKRDHCLQRGCAEPPLIGGLCASHAAALRERTRVEDRALRLLHFGTIDDQAPTQPELATEVMRLRQWWYEACAALHARRIDGPLGDEAEAAMEWCVKLATRLCAQELRHRAGEAADPGDEAYKQVFWQRFENLAAGRRSNGTARP